MVRIVHRLKETECNERFARQYRYEPPPEILLPFSHCVHILSGPNTHALTQTTFNITENTPCVIMNRQGHTKNSNRSKLLIPATTKFDLNSTN